MIDAADYKVRLDVFEGPLDLLLFLIKKDELDIYDIPISSITEQYLGYISMMRELNLDIAGEFLVMAATLAHIKSRLLLPMPAEAGEEDEGDPREELVRRLLEYMKYKEAASTLADRPRLGRDVFDRGPAFEKPEPPDDDEGVPAVDTSLFQLLEALKLVLDDIPTEVFHEVHAETVSVTDKARWLGRILAARGSVTFQELFRGSARRVDVIATFLAMLEMTRMQVLSIYQSEPQGPIRIGSRLDPGKDPSEVLGGRDLEASFTYDGSTPAEEEAEAGE